MKRSITTTLNANTVERIETIAEKLSIGDAAVVRQCVNKGLPEVEREFGIQTEVVKNGKRKAA